jgi:hypothetical protein
MENPPFFVVLFFIKVHRICQEFAGKKPVAPVHVQRYRGISAVLRPRAAARGKKDIRTFRKLLPWVGNLAFL